MTHYLTPQQVLFIHARLIATTGGEHEVRDVGLLTSAMARPQATFDGANLYPDLFEKAAAAIRKPVEETAGNSLVPSTLAYGVERVKGVK